MPKSTMLLIAALLGCHSSMDDMSSMRATLDDSRRETHRHLEAARAATTMEDIRHEVETHRRGMMAMMSDLDMTMHGMSTHCGGLDGMRAMHGELDSEMTQHLASMNASIVLAAAQTEVERHAESMFRMMDGMDAAMGSMHCR